MQQGIISIMAQYADGSPIEPKGILSKWWNDCVVVWSWDDDSKEMQETLWGFIKEHCIFPFEQEKLANMLQWKQYLMRFGGSNVLSTSTMCRGAYHRWISLGISRQMNGTHSYNNIPLHKL
jgi:hypothetical protein